MERAVVTMAAIVQKSAAETAQHLQAQAQQGEALSELIADFAIRANEGSMQGESQRKSDGAGAVEAHQNDTAVRSLTRCIYSSWCDYTS